MHSALRLINLAVVVVAVFAVARPRFAANADADAAYEAGRWIGAMCLSFPSLLAFFGLRRHASRRLRMTALLCWILLFALACLGGLSAALLRDRVWPAMLGVAVIAILCAVNIWGLRSRSAQEDAGDEIEGGWLIARYWRGELPLGAVFWAGGAMVLLIQALQMAVTGLLSEMVSLRTAATLVLVMSSTGLLLFTLQAVGVWRSASRRSRQGSTLWPVMAKVSVVASILAGGFLGAIILWLPLREHALIAAGGDRLPPIEARLTTGDSVLLLHGTFGTGSADRVRRLLDGSPSVKTVALSSPGGRLREAADVAAMVRQRKLDTYVDTRCESACTFVFLAGSDRAATPNARIGFHRPSLDGITPVAFDPATDGMLSTYRAAGIPADFLDRVAATEPGNMWYPSPRELEQAGVINRVSLGGETSAIGYLAAGSRQELESTFRGVPMLVAMERHFPGTIEAAVQAAWMERTQGGVDAAVGNAARNVIIERYPRILASASDASLDQFAALIVEQMKAAKAVSAEACQLLLAGQLNVAYVLSPRLVQREHDWALAVLQADALAEREPVDAARFRSTMDDATAALPPELAEVIGAFGEHAGEPARQCDATIALYDRITSLPPQPRHLLLRGMFQAGAL